MTSHSAGPDQTHGSHEKIEFENEHVKIVRVTTGPLQKSPLRTRRDRVLVWLSDAHELRTESGGKHAEVRHKFGDVAFRSGSQHQLENLEDKPVELIVIELKRQ